METSILVVLERNGAAARVLARAVTLARLYAARLEIFMCEAEAAYALQHQYDPHDSDKARQSGLNKSHAWIERLWQSLDVADVAVNIEVVYESPRYEAIRRKVQRLKPEFVLQDIGSGSHCTYNVSDSDLVRTCPVPLLLTRGKAWKARPTVAAAIDISGEEPPEQIRRVLLAAQYLATRCKASLELLYANPGEPAGVDAVHRHTTRLSEYAAAAEVRAAAVHVVNGDPGKLIPEFARARGYDLLVLGALTHRQESTTQIGTLTQQLLESLECDMLLVRGPARETPRLGLMERSSAVAKSR